MRPIERGVEASIQLTPLRSFVMAAELGSFAEVARSLGYTEPAIHLQITALKTVAGGELFQRVGRRLQPTPLGAALLPHAIAALAAVQQLTSEIGNWRASSGSVVRIGLGRSSGTYLYPYVAATLARVAPHVVLEPSIMPIDDVIDSLCRGAIDLAIITGLRVRVPQLARSLHITAAPLAPYRWTLAARPQAPASPANRPCCPSSKVFVPDYASSMAASISERVQGVLANAEIVITPNAESAKEHALAGRGFAYVPEYVCRLEVSNQELAHYLPREQRQRSTVDIGHARPPRHPEIAPAVAALRALKSQLQYGPLDGFASQPGIEVIDALAPA